MKTPKRTYTTCFWEWGDEFAGRLSSGQQRAYARWHRKNRVKQLKRSIEKYKYGTHLRGSVGAAYRRLQCLVRPGRHAAITKWAKYFKELRQIQEHITCAITIAAIVLAYDSERKAKERKEQQ